MERKRTLTVIEGRPENKKISEDFNAVTRKRGWGFAQVLALDSMSIAEYKLSHLPLDYVVFRNLTGNNYVESERLLQYLKKKHSIVINSNATGSRAVTSDKHFQQGLFLLDPFLRQYALPTYEAKSKEKVLSYIRDGIVSFPIVLKERHGTSGKGIILIREEADLDTVANYNDYVVEQYKECECDWRVFVIGGTAVGVMRKQGNAEHPEDFYAWSAGHVRTIEKDQNTIELLGRIACRAAEVSRLEYTGVDIIRAKDNKEIHILETNYAAGWMNFIPITNINIPDLVLDWMEERGEIGTKPVRELVKNYIERRKKYLPRETKKQYDDILMGKKGMAEEVRTMFSHEEDNYICDTGKIFKELSTVYDEVVEQGSDADYNELIAKIESLPLSWAGNFIGPKVGTLEQGAILSAFYLFIVGKSRNL